MTNRTCSVNGCDRAPRAGGYCNAHYIRMRNGKSLDVPLRQHHHGSECSAGSCARKATVKGLCHMHYKRKCATGNLADPPRTIPERFWIRVEKTDDCWNWTGTLNDQGYGMFFTDATTRVRAHRVSYVLAYGELADDREIDHRCHNHRCVRPDHLRATNHKQNAENRSGPYVNNTSGVRGVCWDARRQRWFAQVTHNYKHHFAGYFVDLKDAEAAVIAKRNELFTHNDRDRIA